MEGRQGQGLQPRIHGHQQGGDAKPAQLRLDRSDQQGMEPTGGGGGIGHIEGLEAGQTHVEVLEQGGELRHRKLHPLADDRPIGGHKGEINEALIGLSRRGLPW